MSRPGRFGPSNAGSYITGFLTSFSPFWARNVTVVEAGLPSSSSLNFACRRKSFIMANGNTPFWLGGVAASMAASCTHPLDVVKVRMQTLEASSHHRPSMISVLRASIAQSGCRSLYAGLTACLMRQMSYSLVRLGTYEELKARISKGGPPSTVQLVLAASLAGGIGGIAGNPADILLVRMTSDSTRPPEKRYGYRNALTGLTCLVKEEGVRGLARGLATNTVRAMLMTASQVASYDFFKSMLLRNPIPLVDYQLRDNLLLHVIASTMAGTIATTVCAPADVIRSRVMAASGKSSVTRILAQSLRAEGPMFLLKGWTPAWIRLGPNTVLLFVFFEQLKKGWHTMTS
ncbi:putative mitochondrial carrier (TC 2.A.29) family protein [Lyophyllum shimeji]|uniref:Mitochondrial carrier (TC 2.A.29) family protein n=1 Tax=Lyophyllum shimeji TaxID=47721 RepID=A0A9P3PIR6_LYOSH|nr:putative mitochondrial carrier (TC 2.A.29) family protein [Lyophyllum shimeji]